MVNSQTYRVIGMTCDHCVRAVSEEVRALDGVSDVAVDLESGTVTVTATSPVEDAAVAGAVEAAGYALAG